MLDGACGGACSPSHGVEVVGGRGAPDDDDDVRVIAC